MRKAVVLILSLVLLGFSTFDDDPVVDKLSPEIAGNVPGQGSLTAKGASWQEIQRIFASDGVCEDRFGWAVDFYYDFAVVGIPQADDNGDSSGAACIFRRVNGVWQEYARLAPRDGEVNDYFGWSVAIQKTYVLIGAYGDDENGSMAGSVYVYRIPDCKFIQKIVPSDLTASDHFGIDVAVSGSYAVIGAVGDSMMGLASGSAYIYKLENQKWIKQKKITASDAAPFDHFGGSVDISGDYVIVGADGNDDNGSRSGSAYIFHGSGIYWSQQKKLLADDGEAGDMFGCSVAIDGQNAVVGAKGDDEGHIDYMGSAYVFHGNRWVWQQEAKLIADDVTDHFGWCVDIHDDRVVAGVFYSHTAYVFQKKLTGWYVEQKFTPDDVQFGDHFGCAVEIKDGLIMIGAFNDKSDVCDQAGTVYIFQEK